ncbi:hypothetical protein AAP_05517 [Ascosphaera apis ARSEF 7405]|uniref:Transmembrane protein n=1 Tax=Ascosphaera apis ARSEF 7405 TaxID=392613 RepID=A0A167VJ73_9EURO|nr:hypothetical protein AAP_05517 [Ascosphaera apis ARSEF 7405]
MTTDQIIITEKEVGLTDKEFAREADRQEAITDNRKTRKYGRLTTAADVFYAVGLGVFMCVVTYGMQKTENYQCGWNFKMESYRADLKCRRLLSAMTMTQTVFYFFCVIPVALVRLLRSLNARSVRDNRTNRRIRAEQRGDIHVNGCPETCARCKITDQKWNEMRSIMYDIQGLVVESSALTKEAKRLRRRDRAQLADWEAALAGFY